MSKVVVITGAGRGIGLSATQLFLENGWRVCASDIDLKQAEKELERDISAGNVLLHEADVTQEDSVKALFDAAMGKFGRVDSAVANAGLLAPIKPWVESGADDVDKMMNVNVKGVFFTVKHAVEAFKASGASESSDGAAARKADRSLVLLSSVASTYGQPGMAAYFAPLGVRTNTVQPGATDTAMFGQFPAELQTVVKGSNTLNRAATPREVAEVIYFLASDKSSFMNGSTVAVHAGQTPT